MEHARARNKLCTSQLFSRLIKRNRNNVQNFTNCIYKNGSYLFLPKDQRRVFAEYYEDLSQPSNDNYDNSYLALCNIRQQFADDEMKAAQTLEIFQEHEIKYTIESINSNKACGESGKYAEHLTNCKHIIAPILTRTFNKILEIRKVPEVFKTVITFPVLEKDKVPTMVNSYRGITVTPIIGKILEYSMLKKLTFKDKSELQSGFTTGLTSLMSSLIISESRFERMPKNTNLIMGIVDVQSDFDVVQHNILLDKLFKTNTSYSVDYNKRYVQRSYNTSEMVR